MEDKDIEERTIEIIAEVTEVATKDITKETLIEELLNMPDDDEEREELLTALEVDFNIEFFKEQKQNITTVGQVIGYIKENLPAQPQKV